MELGEILDRFLEVEETSDLPYWEISGVKLWPIIRTSLLFSLLDHKMGASNDAGASLTLSGYAHLIRTLLLASPRQLMHIRRSAVAAISVASLRRLVVEGRYFDVIYDFYRMIIPDMLILEDPWGACHATPRFSPVVVDLDWIKVLSVLLGRVSRRHKKYIADFMNAVDDLLSGAGLAVDPVAKGSIERLVPRSLIEAFLLRRLVTRIRPNVLFMDGAAYGGRRAVICKMCRELNITIIEPQHGVVNRYHPAYNYAPSYRDRFGEYLPDYFLTFGSYWSEELERFPVRKVVIGNPYLVEQKSALEGKKAHTVCCRHDREGQQMVLVISQPTVTEVTVSLAVRLRDLLPPRYTIIYRPHPAETLSTQQERLLGSKVGLRVERGELYSLLTNVTCVVGIYSTVLFEAAAFGKPVFVLDSPMSRAYVPTCIGRFFTSAEELTQGIIECDKIECAPVPEHLWASNWRGRLKRFMDTVLPNARA